MAPRGCRWCESPNRAPLKDFRPFAVLASPQLTRAASLAGVTHTQDDEDLQSLPPPVTVVDMMGNADCPPLESFEAGSAETNSGTFEGMRISDSQMSFGSDFLRMSQPDDLDLLPLQGSESLEDLAMSGASDFDQALEMRISGGNYSGGMSGQYAQPPAMAPPAPPGDVAPAGGDDDDDDVGAAAGGKPPRARKPPPAAGELVMGLPKNKDGRPKPAPPWIAAAVYWIATQPPLQARKSSNPPHSPRDSRNISERSFLRRLS